MIKFKTELQRTITMTYIVRLKFLYNAKLFDQNFYDYKLEYV